MKYRTVLLLSSCFYLGPAMANSPPPGNLPPPKMPVQAISHDLGVTSVQFQQCFDKLPRVPRGEPGPQGQRRANKQRLLACLQKANSAITGPMLDRVMDRYRPSGRPPMGPPPNRQDGSQPPGKPVPDMQNGQQTSQGPGMGQPPILNNDPRRPVDAISHDLGITPQQFVECFKRVRPTPGGARPESADRVHANKRALLSCLQKANPKITNDSLDKVMDRYRPGGRAAQVPMQR